MDRENPIVLKTKENTFVFKEVLDLEKRGIAVSKLEGDIQQYNDILGQNSIFGLNGSYTIGGITTKSDIPSNVSVGKLKKQVDINQIDLVATYVSQKNAPKGDYKESDAVIINFKQKPRAQARYFKTKIN